MQRNYGRCFVCMLSITDFLPPLVGTAFPLLFAPFSYSAAQLEMGRSSSQVKIYEIFL